MKKKNYLIVAVVLLTLAFMIQLFAVAKGRGGSGFSSENYSLTFIDLSKTTSSIDYYGIIILVLVALSVGLILSFLLVKEPSKDPYLELTKMEKRVALLMQQSLSNKEIAGELSVSVSTIKTHVSNIYKKMEVSSRSELIEIVEVNIKEKS